MADDSSYSQALNAALASARSKLGENEVPNREDIKSYLRDGGQNLDPHTAAWCASFVSSALAHAGFTPPASGAWAPNYLNYGSSVDPKNVQAGNILVANSGHHVGLAEGPMRMGQNGPEVQMIAGNERDPSGQYSLGPNRSQVGMVGERWVPLSEYSARGEPPPNSAPFSPPAAQSPQSPQPLPTPGAQARPFTPTPTQAPGPIDPSIIAQGGTSPPIPTTPGTTINSNPAVAGVTSGQWGQLAQNLKNTGKALGLSGDSQQKPSDIKPSPMIGPQPQARNVSPLLGNPQLYAQRMAALNQPMTWGGAPPGQMAGTGYGMQAQPSVYGTSLMSNQQRSLDPMWMNSWDG